MPDESESSSFSGDFKSLFDAVSHADSSFEISCYHQSGILFLQFIDRSKSVGTTAFVLGDSYAGRYV